MTLIVHDFLAVSWTNPTATVDVQHIAEKAYGDRLYELYEGKRSDMEAARQAAREHRETPKLMGCWSTVNALAAVEAKNVAGLSPSQFLQSHWKVDFVDNKEGPC